MQKIPMALITGFLGTGKTTFLEYTARRLADQRIVYLVNDFSPVDVDGARLDALGPNTVSVPGGSIFCKCLVGQFVKQLNMIAEQLHTADSPVRGVVVEASGIANPKVVEQMLSETGLDQLYALSCVLTLAEAGSLHKLLATLPAMTAQLESADVVLLNKVDLYEASQLACAEQQIRRVNAEVSIWRIEQGVADVQLFGERARRGLSGELAGCADPHFERFSVVPETPIDMNLLETRLLALADQLYRAKGYLPVVDGLVYVDWSTAGLHMISVGRIDKPVGLALIARSDRHADVRQLVRDLERGKLSAG